MTAYLSQNRKMPGAVRLFRRFCGFAVAPLSYLW